MKSLKKTLSIILEALALLGLIVVLVIAIQFARVNFLPSNGSNANASAAYPPPGITPIYTPLPTYTPVPSQTPTPKPIVLDNGWYLYVDKDAGFSLSYPPDVFFHTSKEGRLSYKSVHIQFKIPDAGYQGIEINVLTNPQNRPIENIVQEVYSSNGGTPSIANIQASITPILIGKLSALKCVFQPSIAEFTIYVPYGNKVLYVAPVTEMGLTAFDSQAQELFEKILATFTLQP
jgi:hypothetical protein